MYSFVKKIFSNPTYQSVSEVASFFNISSRELNKIFVDLGWAKKEDRWWIVTKEGVKNGAKQEYNPKNKQKFIKWNSEVKNNIALMHAIKLTKNSKIKSKKVARTTYKEKVDKGVMYEEFVAKFYKEQGYYVWEHGKEKGRQDAGIDLIAKKDNEILLIQCKNWSEKSKFKIYDKDVKASRTDARLFLKENPIFISYKLKFVYVLSGEFLHKSAYHHIKENNNFLDFKIIEMNKKD